MIAGAELSIDNITQTKWESMLEEAKTCLDETKGYRGRKKQQYVTLRSNSKRIIKEVSPHLTIWTIVKLDNDIAAELKLKFAELQPVYNWVLDATNK